VATRGVKNARAKKNREITVIEEEGIMMRGWTEGAQNLKNAQ
jgi:hypothetical protein